MFPESYKIDDVPVQRDLRANNCVPASIYMMINYYEDSGYLGFPLLPYDEYCALFPKGRRIGYPPGKIKEYLSNDEKLATFTINHRKATSILELEHYIRQNQPVIVIYDYHYYQTYIEGRNMHFSVMVGYSPENIVVNDLFHGADYSLSRARFIEAWRLRQNKYILVIPPKQSLKDWIK